MAPSSVSDLKKTLRELLADPTAEARFQRWMAEGLLNASDTPGALEFLLAVQSAFADAAKGLYTPAKLRGFLDDLTKEETASTPSQTTAKSVPPGIPSEPQRYQIFAMDREGDLVQV